MAGSSRKPETSLITDAPASIAAAATDDFTVSTESGTLGHGAHSSADHRDNALQLLLARHGSRTLRASGLSPHVEHVRALGDQSFACAAAAAAEKTTPVAEAVGGNVDDSHDEGTIQLQHAQSRAATSDRAHARVRRLRRSRRRDLRSTKQPRPRGLRLHDDARRHGKPASTPVLRGRGGSGSPRTSIATSSAVSVSRSSSASAIRSSRSRLSISVCFARPYDSLIRRVTSASTSCAVRSDTSR